MKKVSTPKYAGVRNSIVIDLVKSYIKLELIIGTLKNEMPHVCPKTMTTMAIARMPWRNVISRLDVDFVENAAFAFEQTEKALRTGCVFLSWALQNIS